MVFFWDLSAEYKSDNMIKFICLFACFTYAYADVASAGRNQYLPPDKGYNYDKPVVAFPSNPRDQQVPFPRTTLPPRTQQPTNRPTQRIPSVQPTRGYPSGPQGDHSDVSYEGEARYPDAPFGGNSNNANQGYKY